MPDAILFTVHIPLPPLKVLASLPANVRRLVTMSYTVM